MNFLEVSGRYSATTPACDMHQRVADGEATVKMWVSRESNVCTALHHKKLP